MPGDCPACKLYEFPRANGFHCVIQGDGNPDAEIALVGEGPGENEEGQNRFFVGRAGNLLDLALNEAGLPRSLVWMDNAVRCRPRNAMGGNRKPKPAEINYCRPFLDEALAKLRFLKVIVALGDAALAAIFGDEKPTGGVTHLQGRVLWSERHHAWVVCSVHPAFVLRRQSERQALVDDLLLAQRIARTGAPAATPMVEYVLVRDFDAADRMMVDLYGSDFAFDFETNGIDLQRSWAFLAAFSAGPGRTYVVPRYLSGLIPAWPREALRRLDREYLAKLMLSPGRKKGHHVAFDQNMSYTTFGVWPVNVTCCTLLKSHTVDNHLPERMHNLKRCGNRHTDFGLYDQPLENWLMTNGYKKRGQGDMGFLWKAPNEIVWPYAATDVYVTHLIDIPLEARLKEEKLEVMYYEERFPLGQEYAVMDRRGVRLASKDLNKLSSDLGLVIEDVGKRIAEMVGHPLNPNSHPQVANFCFTERGLPIMGRTDLGAPAVTEEVLLNYADVEPVIPLILHYRSYTKIKGTFLDGGKKKDGGLRAALDPRTGIAMMNTQLIAAETFRLATRKPFPIHVLPRPLDMWNCVTHGMYQYPGDDNKSPCCDLAVPTVLSIRSLLIPDDGWVFLSRDYKQQEYAIQVVLAKQRDMEEAIFDHGEDAHEYMMRAALGKTARDFGGTMIAGQWAFMDKNHAVAYKNYRTDIKNGNFAVLYRADVPKFARMMKKSEEYAMDIMQRINERIPMVRQWQDEKITELRQYGRVWGAYGTYRYLPGIKSIERRDQAEAERAGCNFPIQEGGAHYMFRSMLRLAHRWRGGRAPWQKASFPARIMFTVHDEMVAMARRDVWEQADAEMQEEMERPQVELTGACRVPRGIATTGGRPLEAWT